MVRNLVVKRDWYLGDREAIATRIPVPRKGNNIHSPPDLLVWPSVKFSRTLSRFAVQEHYPPRELLWREF